jgi:hypothetical protein
MHYSYDLNSMLSCSGADGPVWALRRFRAGISCPRVCKFMGWSKMA